MKFCKLHAQKLRQAVIERGLGVYLSGGDPEKICPLCAMGTEFEGFVEDKWIGHAVTEAADAAKQAGLLTVQ
jgi:hypothetical protein